MAHAQSKEKTIPILTNADPATRRTRVRQKWAARKLRRLGIETPRVNISAANDIDMRHYYYARCAR